MLEVYRVPERQPSPWLPLQYSQLYSDQSEPGHATQPSGSTSKSRSSLTTITNLRDSRGCIISDMIPSQKRTCIVDLDQSVSSAGLLRAFRKRDPIRFNCGRTMSGGEGRTGRWSMERGLPGDVAESDDNKENLVSRSFSKVIAKRSDSVSKKVNLSNCY